MVLKDLPFQEATTIRSHLEPEKEKSPFASLAMAILLVWRGDFVLSLPEPQCSLCFMSQTFSFSYGYPPREGLNLMQGTQIFLSFLLSVLEKVAVVPLQ